MAARLGHAERDANGGWLLLCGGLLREAAMMMTVHTPLRYALYTHRYFFTVHKITVRGFERVLYACLFDLFPPFTVPPIFDLVETIATLPPRQRLLKRTDDDFQRTNTVTYVYHRTVPQQRTVITNKREPVVLGHETPYI